MKKILILLFSIFLLVSCDTLQTSNTITIETGNSYWRYKPYYINYLSTLLELPKKSNYY